MSIFDNISNDYAPVVFWSWNNLLDGDELTKQIRQMKSAGLGGFMIHARSGLKTEYLSDEWFRLVKICLSEANRLNMNVWIYDENGFPSGFVGGKLLGDENNLARYLVYEVKDFYDESAYAVYSVENGVKRLNKGDEAQKYHTLYLRLSPSNTDILNPDVTDKFIAETHEKYYERYKEYFGGTIKGFFTDEPQYYRYATPTTFHIEREFLSAYGEDVKDGLLHLFLSDEQSYPFKIKYYRLLNKLYVENFYKKLYNWCSSHGVMLTGHSVEETYFYTQMWGGADCATTYEFEHIPGVDNLTRNSTPELTARSAWSVCAQTGKKQLLTETFGCAGYDASPRVLKRIADAQFVRGVNLLCYHLFPYSLAGQGKTDYPPCFSSHMTWWKDFSKFNLYYTRLGYLLASGEDVTECAVLSPMESIYPKYIRLNEDLAADIDKRFTELTEYLNGKRVQFHIVNEKILANHGRVEGCDFIVGQKSYKTIVLPYMPEISSVTYELLRRFSAGGGKIIVYDGAPRYIDGVRADVKIESTANVDELSCGNFYSDGSIVYTERILGGKEYLFLLNEGKDCAKVTLNAVYKELDLCAGTYGEPVNEITLEAGTSALLEKTDEHIEVKSFGAETDITKSFVFEDYDENNLTIDFVRVSFDGEHYGKPEYVYALFERLIKSGHRGKIFLKYAFTYSGGKNLKLRREKDKGYNFKLNGESLFFGQSEFDVLFEEADICPVLGENEFTYEIDFRNSDNVAYALYDENASDSVRTCLVLDTTIEPVYIRGKFYLDGETVSDGYSPVNIRSIHESGLKSSDGTVKFSADVYVSDATVKILVKGNYTTCGISVNGKYCGSLCLNDGMILRGLKANSLNRIELSLTGSLRNSIGPLHMPYDEDGGISPFNFTMFGTWNNGETPHFRAQKRYAPFGATQVSVKKIK